MHPIARRRLSLLTLLLATAATAQQPAAYVAHEWGTFTSMVGTDGAALEGLHHEEAHLPPFVHDLQRLREWGSEPGVKLRASRVTQKMETPVIYFYSDTAIAVRAEVWFQRGLMTQFFPLPNAVHPELPVAQRQRFDLGKVASSCLVWDIDVLPRAGGPPAGIPEVTADDPWHFARQTGASYVRTRPPAGSPARVEAEHYLFYRGIGRWQPALQLDGRGERPLLTNRLEHELGWVMAIELTPAGGRHSAPRAVAAGAETAFDLAAAPLEPDRERFARRVGAEVLRALVAAGLYEDEARAMVATWSRSWFQEDGARLVYLLPRPTVDTVLPLALDPPPQQLVRVLVGRLEFITDKVRERIERALLQEARGDDAGRATLAALDRFLEPQLRNVERCGSSAAVREAAARRLVALTR